MRKTLAVISILMYFSFQNCTEFRKQSFGSHEFASIPPPSQLNEVFEEEGLSQDREEAGPIPNNEEFSIAQFSLASNNRNYPGKLFGGWGPHLRGFFTSESGDLWFAYDSDSTVSSTANPQINYVKLVGSQWTWVASQNIEQFSISQNMAHIMRNGYIFSYGVGSMGNPNRVYECYFHLQSNSTGCNNIWVNNTTLIEGQNWNYHGAAVSDDGSITIVYWTEVGVNGGPGKFFYAYKGNDSTFWNLVETPISHNGLMYIHAKIVDNKFYGVGQTWAGGVYPAGRPYGVAIEFDIGQNVQFYPLLDETGDYALSSTDILVDPLSKAVHVWAQTNQGIEYFYKPGGASWNNHLVSQKTLPGRYRARFVEQDQGSYYFISSLPNSSSIELFELKNELSNVQAFTSPIEIPIDDATIGGVHALYTNSRQYQAPGRQNTIEVGIIGRQGESDHIIHHIRVSTKD